MHVGGPDLDTYVVRDTSPPIFAPKKANNLGKTSYVVSNIESAPTLAPKKAKNLGEIPML